MFICPFLYILIHRFVVIHLFSSVILFFSPSNLILGFCLAHMFCFSSIFSPTLSLLPALCFFFTVLRNFHSSLPLLFLSVYPFRFLSHIFGAFIYVPFFHLFIYPFSFTAFIISFFLQLPFSFKPFIFILYFLHPSSCSTPIVFLFIYHFVHPFIYSFMFFGKIIALSFLFFSFLQSICCLWVAPSFPMSARFFLSSICIICHKSIMISDSKYS